jgi:hypothetical protein
VEERADVISGCLQGFFQVGSRLRRADGCRHLTQFFVIVFGSPFRWHLRPFLIALKQGAELGIVRIDIEQPVV